MRCESIHHSMEGSYFKYSQLKILRPGVTVGSMSIDLRGCSDQDCNLSHCYAGMASIC